MLVNRKRAGVAGVPVWLRLSPVVCATLAVCSQAALAQTAPADTNAAKRTAETTQLEEVVVSAESTNASEATRSYENPAVSSATGLLLTRRETPQSVSVVTRQQMDDDNVQTLDDALLNATGISATQLDVGGRTSYRARGFEITNFRVDGALMNGQTGFSGQGLALNMDLYDRVEILRGANGLLGATGDPAGVVDMVRKEPRKTRFGSVGVTLGSHGGRHLTADLNQPLNADGSVRSRFVFSGDDSNTFRDREKDKSLGLLASFAADITRDTKASLGLQYERRRIDGATWGTNVPIWYADGTETHFKRSLNSSADWSYSERESKTIFGALEHRFDNNWTTKLSGSWTRGDVDSHLAVAKANRGTVSAGYWAQDGSGAYLNTYLSEAQSTTKNLQWSLNGPFEALGRRHQFMMGANYNDNESTAYGLDCFNSAGKSVACMNRISNGFAIGDWREFIRSGEGIGEVTTARNGKDTVTRIKTYGTYAATRLSITDPLSVIVGARLSWQRNFSNGVVTSDFSHQVTPYLGAVYDLNRNYSLYASYTDVFEAQSQRRVDGTYLDPKSGTAMEVGVKGEWLDGQFDGSLAVFRNKQKDVATIARDASGDPLYVTGDEGVTAYVNGASGVTTKGFEVDFSGRITPSWNVYGGYTYLSVNNPNSTGAEDDPKHLLRLNTSYRLPGSWNKLTLGTGLTAQSKMHQVATGTSHPTEGANVNIDLKAYTLFHAMARYEINKDLVATLNISNLFDKTYYRQYGFYSGAIYGEPRTVRLNLQAKF